MSALREERAESSMNAACERLNGFEGDHQMVLRQHEQLRRKLDAAISDGDVPQMRAVWQEYRQAVSGLEQITEQIESLRLTVV
jgi:hypothetical protein